MKTTYYQQSTTIFFAGKRQGNGKVKQNYRLSDDYSPTGWDQEQGESSQDYEDRYGDLESWNEWSIDHDND